MQFATAFVEYLVTGCGGLVWLTLVVGVTRADVEALEPAQLTLLLPVLYVVGMFIDAVASIAFRPLKTLARTGQWRRRIGQGAKEPAPPVANGTQQPTSAESTEPSADGRTSDRMDAGLAFIVLHSADLGREVQVRSSRDRIARGVCLNSLLFAAAVLVRQDHAHSLFCQIGGTWTWVGMSLGALALAVFAFVIWSHFEYLTERFRNQAIDVITTERAHIRVTSSR